MVLQNSWNNTLIDGLTVRFANSAQGDIYYLDQNNVFQRLAIGSTSQVLTVAANNLPQWSNPNETGSASLGDNSVGFVKLQNINPGRLLGRRRTDAGNGTPLAAGTIQELSQADFIEAMALGTAAFVNTGTSAGNVPLLDANGRLNSSVVPQLFLNVPVIVTNETARKGITQATAGQPIVAGLTVKESATGRTYILRDAADLNNDANWTAIGDTAIDAADIATGVINTARLGTGSANNTSFLRGDGTWQETPPAFRWNGPITATNVLMQPNNGYIINTTGQGLATLPTTIAVGETIRVVGRGDGGWRIVQNASQQIRFLNSISIAGATGYIQTPSRADYLGANFSSVELLCVQENTQFQVISSTGILDVNAA